MSGIERVPGAHPRARLALDQEEAHILAELATQLGQLISDTPDDAAAVKLFPRGYDDPAAQAEYSRFTRADLSDRKTTAASRIASALSGPTADGVVIELDAESAWEWLTFLTDIRLVLAERLSEPADAQERGVQQGLFDWAAYLQGALVEHLRTE